MRIYSVESKNLFFVNFIDFKIRVFSPRELFYSVIGIWMIASALQGTTSAIFGFFGVILLIFGYIPYMFLPLEIQLINFLRFHFKNNSTSKKAKKESASLVGCGEVFVYQDVDDEVIPEIQGPEIISIPNLDSAYTITLKTKARERFLPVSIYVDDIFLANTSTDRKGRASCSVLIDAYGIKRFQVKDDSGNVLYEREVKFTP